MNWKIIFQLSVFGLIMAFATISLVPEKVEPAFWLVIFLFGAWIIAKVCHGKYFLHGFVVSLVNCIWITIAHSWFYDSYIAHHPSTGAALASDVPAALVTHPREVMIIFAPIFGVGFGIIFGFFCFIAAKILKKNPAQ